MLDQTDLKILELLLSNSRMQWQEIGEQVHLTGQAVKNRIDRMEKLGVIEGYTADRLTEYKTSKGAVQFPYSKPLPLDLIAEIAQWCYQTNNHH